MNDSPSVTRVAITNAQRGQVLRLMAAIGLDDQERHELSEYLTGQPSLQRMSSFEAQRLLDALRGYTAILSLMEARPRVRAMLRARAAL